LRREMENYLAQARVDKGDMKGTRSRKGGERC